MQVLNPTLLLTLLFLFVAVDEQCNGNSLDFLNESKPLPEGAAVLFQPDGKERELYLTQLNAVSDVSKYTTIKSPHAFVNCLIPYLNYSPSCVDVMTSPRFGTPLNEIKKVFPVFSLLIITPGLDEALQNYSLDNTQALSLRAGALAVLRVRNIDLFENSMDAIMQRGSGGGERIEQLGFLRAKSYFFWGLRHLK